MRNFLAGFVLAAMFFGSGALADIGTDGSTVGPATVTVTVPIDSFLGQCAVVNPLVAGDPCETAAQIIQYVVLDELGKGAYHAKWVKDNPGENARLLAHLANPKCATGTVGLVQDMKTHYGAALFALTQAWACLPMGPPKADGTGAIHPRELPLKMGVPDPPLDPKRGDKTPPTAPGPITVSP